METYSKTYLSNFEFCPLINKSRKIFKKAFLGAMNGL